MIYKEYHVRSYIMTLLKQNYGTYPIWKAIEPTLAVMCSNIPEANDEKSKHQLIRSLVKIKSYLLEHQITEGMMKFLIDEIDRYKGTRQVSLYSEDENRLDAEVIDKYANMGIGTEGIVAIHLKLNYNQIKKLTNGIYKKTGLVKFYISREKTFSGQIIAEMFEHPQKIPIATLIRSDKAIEETGQIDERILLFGEKWNKRQYRILKEIESPFYVYQFITEQNEEMIIFTAERQAIGDYVVTGMKLQSHDFKALTPSMKLPTKLPFLFVHSIQNRILQYKDHKEFFFNMRKLGISRKNDNLFNMLFTVRQKKTNYLLKQPDWFKWLVWSWLLHERQGLLNPYPLHLMIVGPPNSGKSMLFNSLHARSKETRSIFSGSSSTLKRLIPSFKYSPAQLGYLAESNRFAFCDELFRAFLKVRGGDSDSARDENVAMLNDLLEHQKRQAGSGVSSVHVAMTARIIAGTNPIRHIHSIIDLLNSFDKSFLSRWLIYHQDEDHVNMVLDSRDSELKKLRFNINPEDLVSAVDYLQSFPAIWKPKRVQEIYESVIPLLSEQLLDHYKRRHKHHIDCIMDGLVKARSLFELNTDFTATEEDYEMLNIIWKKIIKNWIKPEAINNLPVNQRIYYLPEKAQFLYWEIAKKKKGLTRLEVKELYKGELTVNEYYEAVITLREAGLIYEELDMVYPFFIKKDGQDQKSD